jgi:hemolysin D
MTAAVRTLAPPRRSHEERDFLPAALEIIETPASPAGRAIGGAIIAFLLVALAWAVFGRVDIVATAPGKIVPAGRSKVIQPLDRGIVRAIHVQDGQSVLAGEVLIELDPTESEADRARLAGELLASRLDVARLEALLSAGFDPLVAFAAPAGAGPKQIDLARQFVASAAAESKAQLAALDDQAAQREANRATVAASIEKMQAMLPLLRQQRDMRKTLFDRQIGSKLLYLETQARVIEMEGELVVQRGRLAEAVAAAKAAVETRRETEAERRRGWLATLAEAQTKVQSLAQDLVKADQRRKEQVLLAPIDGVVQQLAVHTIGGVVRPADPLLVLVPHDSKLEIEAIVANADIGFVHAGQPAKVKVATFPFTRYGLIDGRLLSVSSDAVSSRPDSRANEDPATGREPSFTARISLDREVIAVGDRLVALKPGMAVTVEIDTGRRRIIDYLLSPLLRYSHESLRER